MKIKSKTTQVFHAASVLGRLGGAAARDKSGGAIQRRAIAVRWARYRSQQAAKVEDPVKPVLKVR
jgi:hypothetical protein